MVMMTTMTRMIMIMTMMYGHEGYCWMMMGARGGAGRDGAGRGGADGRR